MEAAWELRKGLGYKPDCSHFVNAVYAQAGFDYEYIRSGDIFAGVGPFQRVFQPQSGDVIVWMSHVGIVVDPEEHTFYSSTMSGFAIESYQSRYWMNQGHPRFYRYLVDEAHAAQLLAHFRAKRNALLSPDFSRLSK
ncbi:MAG TPA: NlpC/P60 family protein [Candidatus Angelobacter sp.]|nr:NlpC/P60 family protein [Candidatus Angelobacter sp.]